MMGDFGFAIYDSVSAAMTTNDLTPAFTFTKVSVIEKAVTYARTSVTKIGEQ